MLAALDHNENVGRQQAALKSGEPAWYRVFPRGLPYCRHWKVRPVKVPKTFEFRREIATLVLKKLYQGNDAPTVPEGESEDPLDVLRRPEVRFGEGEKPERQSLISKRERRFKQ